MCKIPGNQEVRRKRVSSCLVILKTKSHIRRPVRVAPEEDHAVLCAFGEAEEILLRRRSGNGEQGPVKEAKGAELPRAPTHVHKKP